MKKITFYMHPMNINAVEIVKEPSVYCRDDMAYFAPTGINLEDYAQEWKTKLWALERRYAYLERGRSWAIKNFRRLIK